MCVACLNVSTGACSHRWYELKRPCNPDSNLANCPEKLRLEGWEVRKDTCPFCDGGHHHYSTHRLFGSMSSASSVTSSPTISEMGMTPTTRRGSLATLNLSGGQISPLSRTSSGNSFDAIEQERIQRNRDMNDRIMLYLSSDPHEVLPSGRKNYPTYATALARAENHCSPRQDYTAYSNAYRRLSRSSSFSKGWKRVSGKLTNLNAGKLYRIDQ